VAVGPVFFALVKTSLQKGFKAGVCVAIGVSLSDMCYIILAYLGVSQFFDNPLVKDQMAFVGGLVIITFGIITIITKPKIYDNGTETMTKSNYVKQMFKGFLINAINPAVLLFWLGVMSLASVDYDFTPNKIMVFFTSILATVFALDITKVYLSHKLRELVTPKVMRTMYVFVGMALVGFGVKLMFFA
jgi:threonine/homoserine/homoserine lactone efflux protein